MTGSWNLCLLGTCASKKCVVHIVAVLAQVWLTISIAQCAISFGPFLVLFAKKTLTTQRAMTEKGAPKMEHNVLPTNSQKTETHVNPTWRFLQTLFNCGFAYSPARPFHNVRQTCIWGVMSIHAWCQVVNGEGCVKTWMPCGTVPQQMVPKNNKTYPNFIWISMQADDVFKNFLKPHLFIFCS